MDSGYKNKFRRQTRQKQNERRRLRRAEKSLEGEAKGLRKRGLNKRTLELLHKANGKPLAKEMLEDCMLRSYALYQRYDPFDQDGNERMHVNPATGAMEPAGDMELFVKFLDATALYAAWLAPFQSPKLKPVATREQQPLPDEGEEVRWTIDIFNSRGANVARVIDGEVSHPEPDILPDVPRSYHEDDAELSDEPPMEPAPPAEPARKLDPALAVHSVPPPPKIKFGRTT
jgi:hypothetical protein